MRPHVTMPADTDTESLLLAAGEDTYAPQKEQSMNALEMANAINNWTEAKRAIYQFARRHGISTDGNPLDVVTAVLDYATTAAQERAFLHEANQNLAEALNIEKADRQGMAGDNVRLRADLVALRVRNGDGANG
jgi:hypothetical protein